MNYSHEVENMCVLKKGPNHAAEWVIPEQPNVSTKASSIIPFLTFKVNLHAPCCGAHQPTPWDKPEISEI